MPRLGRAAALALAAAGAAEGAPQLWFASVFSDGMVLQRDVRAAVYGMAPPGCKMSVTLTDGGRETEAAPATVGSGGSWRASFAPHPAGGNYTVTAKCGQQSAALHSVTFGDVWFCSGQSNMELGLRNTFGHNDSALWAAQGKYENIRLLLFPHNPQPDPVYVYNSSGPSPVYVYNSSGLAAADLSADQPLKWRSPQRAVEDGLFDSFSALCYYYGEQLSDRLAAANGKAVPVGLIESAFGGTMIESWMPVADQLASCSNITCTANTSLPFEPSTLSQCLQIAVELTYRGAGPNSFLYNGMVGPFVNMTVKGWLWYQGENNLPFHAGNVLQKAGYACMMPTLVSAWRRVWSAEPGTTPSDAPFGYVMLADSTDEGWGANVPQMHWAQTANMGVAPNQYLPGTFMATGHDLADPWDDGCDSGAHCCVDTGSAPDPACGADRGWLVSSREYPGVTEPTTPTAGLTIHPRVKRPLARRLVQAAWAHAYGHKDEPWTGPVLAGCSLRADAGGGRSLVVSFNTSLLMGDSVRVSDYNHSVEASVTWVLLSSRGTRVPDDAWVNYNYGRGKTWWGDDADWVNVNITAGPTSSSITVHLPADGGDVLALKYGHGSPKHQPQDGHSKLCCGAKDFTKDPCPPESCPVSSRAAKLPAMPFEARIVGGQCQCFKPQVCDSA
eukprot:TRINITY_DN24775_c0_g1_i1.p1 TRINITY_DN24775_c0_g1~~TRINITY_DN24775_c0_g1_i1.p1  ORF type:complete len:694 (+),score=180.72 TRINITY_DN24775_c0_g1_i1:72-2084(+)